MSAGERDDGAQAQPLADSVAQLREVLGAALLAFIESQPGLELAEIHEICAHQFLGAVATFRPSLDCTLEQFWLGVIDVAMRIAFEDMRREAAETRHG